MRERNFCIQRKVFSPPLLLLNHLCALHFTRIYPEAISVIPNLTLIPMLLFSRFSHGVPSGLLECVFKSELWCIDIQFSGLVFTNPFCQSVCNSVRWIGSCCKPPPPWPCLKDQTLRLFQHLPPDQRNRVIVFDHEIWFNLRSQQAQNGFKPIKQHVHAYQQYGKRKIVCLKIARSTTRSSGLHSKKTGFKSIDRPFGTISSCFPWTMKLRSRHS